MPADRQVSFYRKYRPMNFGEVYGQSKIKQTLQNAAANRTAGHAYLFAGPRGTGKTTLARIFAKALNCLELKEGEPCNKCTVCVAINKSAAFDLIEIDAASNRGIDEIRELKERVDQVPSVQKHKVYIIDEVHMLTREAFNALLKTLEEPPAHAIFILATTEIHKVPATVISRTQRFDFRFLALKEIEESLKMVAKVEKIKIDDAALKLIAEQAGGGLRDALGLLEQAHTFTKGQITSEELVNLLGLFDLNEIVRLMNLILAGQGKEALGLVDGFYGSGHDLTLMLSTLSRYLRGLILLKFGQQSGLSLSDEFSQQMRRQAEGLQIPQLIDLVRKVIEAERQIKFVTHQHLVIELLVLEMLAVLGHNGIKSQAAKKEEAKSEPVAKEKENVGAKKATDLSEAKLLNSLKKINNGFSLILDGARLVGFQKGEMTIGLAYDIYQKKFKEHIEAVHEILRDDFGLDNVKIILEVTGPLNVPEEDSAATAKEVFELS